MNQDINIAADEITPEPKPIINLLNQIKNKIVYQKQDIDRIKARIKVLRGADLRNLCKQLQKLPSWHEVGDVSFSSWGGKQVEVIISLNKEVKEPSLVRDIVRHGICEKLTKSREYGGGSLRADGKVAGAEYITIEVTGYVPASCTVVYEEVTIPAHVEKRAKVVCDPRDLENMTQD
jgi:hypothetical protein